MNKAPAACVLGAMEQKSDLNFVLKKGKCDSFASKQGKFGISNKRLGNFPLILLFF